MGADFQIKLRDGFRALAAAAPERCQIVNGERDPDAISHDIAMIADMANE